MMDIALNYYNQDPLAPLVRQSLNIVSQADLILLTVITKDGLT